MNAQFDDSAATYSDAVQSSISFIGAGHDYFIRRKVDLLLAIAERHLDESTTGTFLDVGAGVGHADTDLIAHVGALLGCDPSVASLRKAASANPGAAYTAADGTALPFPTASIDLAFAINVLHHVDPRDRDAFVAELSRVVRPGGIVVAFEHNPLNPLTRRSVSNCEFDKGVELLGARELRRRFARAGLEEVERAYVVFTPFDVAWQHSMESHLGRLPLGAQHYVAATRPG